MEVAALPLDELRHRVAVADPVPFLFSGTLRSLPAIPTGGTTTPRSSARSRLPTPMTSMDGAELGLDTEVAERGLQFSGGQRQRLGVARALLLHAEVLILLEPTASVDAATESRMASGIAAYRAGAATVLASTSALVLAQTDRVEVLVDGSVAKSGEHHALIADDPEYRAVVLRGEGIQ